MVDLATCTSALAPIAILRLDDLCDRCGEGTAAMVRVILPSGRTLDFCNHHHRQHATALLAQGAVVVATGSTEGES